MRACHRPTIAADDILVQYGCTKSSQRVPYVRKFESLPNSTASEDNYVDTVVHRSGWSFTAYHSTILNEHDHVRLAEQLKLNFSCSYGSLRSQGNEWFKSDSLEVNNCKLHIPPMLFGNDMMQVKVGASAIALKASDAIMCWAAQVQSAAFPIVLFAK
jgi:hypothetical protein